MSLPRAHAVITGAGVVSALGVGLEALFDGVSRGGCAVAPIRAFDASTFPTRVAAEVPIAYATPDEYGREPRLRDRKAQLAQAAALEAWVMAGLGPRDRGASLSIGLGLEHAFVEDFVRALGPSGFDFTRVHGAPSFRARVDLAAELVRDTLALEGPVMVHASACASGALAVAHASAWIERGLADIVLAGAADSMINPLGIGGMSRLGAPSPRAASDACRPFDLRRDGLAMGEGAAFFVVENAERASRRGAKPLAVVRGFGSTQDAFHVTAPRPDGSAAREAMRRALERAGCDTSEVGYVNAHGTGTPLNDAAEARAIASLLGPVPVSSVKGALGHTMAAAGAIELAASLMVFARDRLPGTCGHAVRDPECPIDVIEPLGRAARVDLLLSNSFGFGGQNAAVVLGRGEA